MMLGEFDRRWMLIHTVSLAVISTETFRDLHRLRQRVDASSLSSLHTYRGASSTLMKEIAEG
jgi:hypothetical protein